MRSVRTGTGMLCGLRALVFAGRRRAIAGPSEITRRAIATKAAHGLAVATGLSALAIAGLTAANSEVRAGPRTTTLTLSVVLDLNTFAFTDASTGEQPTQGPFSVEGDIFDPDDPVEPIGTFEGWGWIILDEDDNAVREKASHIYTIGIDTRGDGIADTGVDVTGGRAPELGAIMAQGHEFNAQGKGFLAVVGGTDDFSNVGGDAVMTFTTGGFDVVFELTGRPFGRIRRDR